MKNHGVVSYWLWIFLSSIIITFSQSSCISTQRNSNEAILKQPASMQFMTNIRNLYLNDYLHDIYTFLHSDNDDIEKLNKLLSINKQKDLLTSLFNVSPGYYSFLKDNYSNQTSRLLDELIKKKKTIVTPNDNLYYFTYCETDIDEYRYISFDGFGKKTNGYLVVTNILSGEFLEKNTYGTCSNIREFPDKVDNFIGIKLHFGASNINCYHISGAFLINIINLVSCYNEGVLAGIERIVQLGNQHQIVSSIQICELKKEMLDYLENVYNFWGIPSKILGNMSKATTFYFFDYYMLNGKHYDKKSGVFWNTDAHDHYFFYD